MNYELRNFVIRHSQFALLLLLLLFVAAGCQKQPTVTVSGVPVTEEVFVAAATTVWAVEVGMVALGDALIQLHTDACGPLSAAERLTAPSCVRATSLLRTSATNISPKILVAIQGAKAQLQLAAATPPGTTQERLEAAVETLIDAFQEAGLWAREEGVAFPMEVTP